MWGFAWQNLVTRPSRLGLAVVGLTIPILAFLGLFSISRGIRDLVGGTIKPPTQETWQVPSRRRP
jgi:putative ABC transport system permease protein